MKGSIITLNLTLDETDVILNSLEEKSLNINALRERLYQDALVQVQKAQQEQAEKERLEMEQNQSSKKKERENK